METQSEFIKRYYKDNPEEEKRQNAMGNFAMPCDCVDGGDKRHWVMVNINGLKAHLDLYLGN